MIAGIGKDLQEFIERSVIEISDELGINPDAVQLMKLSKGKDNLSAGFSIDDDKYSDLIIKTEMTKTVFGDVVFNLEGFQKKDLNELRKLRHFRHND